MAVVEARPEDPLEAAAEVFGLVAAVGHRDFLVAPADSFTTVGMAAAAARQAEVAEVLVDRVAS